ncbi:MAG: hypothetical protein H0U71_04875 [Gammaproteobacteria bacterium]|nr:hypothetical protein [Gammaproteobacteria bacterium]
MPDLSSTDENNNNNSHREQQAAQIMKYKDRSASQYKEQVTLKLSQFLDFNFSTLLTVQIASAILFIEIMNNMGFAGRFNLLNMPNEILQKIFHTYPKRKKYLS